MLLALALASVPVSADLANPGFEDTPFGGEEAPGAGTGWTTFGLASRVQQAAPGPCDPISCAGAHGGTVVLKVSGIAGVFQDFTATEGESFSGGVWAINPANADMLAGGQIGAVNIEWHGAGGFLTAAFGTTIDASAPADEWILLNVSGTAPAGTIFARFVIITGDFLPGGPGGAPRFDDAFFDLTPTDTDGDGDPDVTDPDDDNDGIGDVYDRHPLDDSNAECTTNDGTNATLVGATISAEQTTCASKESVDVSGTTNVGIDGDLLLISEKVSLTDTSVTGNGRLEVINADPCEGCTLP